MFDDNKDNKDIKDIKDIKDMKDSLSSLISLISSLLTTQKAATVELQPFAIYYNRYYLMIKTSSSGCCIWNCSRAYSSR